MMKMLAISGSLRAASNNTMLLRAMMRLAPAGMQIELYGDLGNLPLFNPDKESIDPPYVAAFREQLTAADAVLIASSEYAHGVTGVMKNALDWMVGCEAFVNKPVALLNVSPRAVHAQASLKEIMSVMSARIVEEASIIVPIIGANLDEAAIAAHPHLANALRTALQALQIATERSAWKM
ncbi:NADPH-dependent FMN reductase [Sulfuriferula sp. AH1]|uniref:NADPH-dependent FMN reductase n=1 Tax=Sulfuriferula sp. AH1 TaxID=1985873 RepID=UPI001CB97355|nr:NADPH-dependent FMN reductase [Sulfuriferula sp. AH1]